MVNIYKAICARYSQCVLKYCERGRVAIKVGLGWILHKSMTIVLTQHGQLAWIVCQCCGEQQSLKGRRGRGHEMPHYTR